MAKGEWDKAVAGESEWAGPWRWLDMIMWWSFSGRTMIVGFYLLGPPGLGVPSVSGTMIDHRSTRDVSISIVSG